jgi:2,3-dihydroxy-p-cumate/2,3-dihydroxybenzoate 3,4-dioxygenase
MLRYRQLGSVMLGVSDLARARDFYARLPGLQPVTGDPAGRVRFHVGDPSAMLELSETGRPGLRRIGFQMENVQALERLRAVLSREKLSWTDIGTGIRIVEPHTGAQIDFESPLPAIHHPTAGAIEGFGHVVLRTPAYREAVVFWRDVLGFRLSDEIEGRISLLRCFPNPLHHSLGLANGDRRMFHHLNFRVRDATDLEAIAQDFATAGVRIASGPGVHAPSRNRFLYFYDPDGLTLELANASERFEEGRERAPRVLPDRSESFAVGNVRRDPAMYTVGEIETVD